MAVAASAESTGLMPRVTFADPAVQVRNVRRRIAVTGAVCVVVGFATQVVALVSATWWQATVSGQHTTLHFAAFAPRTSRGFAFMYFGWGAWLIAGLTLGLGLVSCVRWRGAHAFRIVAAVFAVAAATAPIIALIVFAYQADTGVFQVVRDYALGPYLAVLGTLATAFGAAAGSAR